MTKIVARVKRSDTECAILWRALESIVGTHTRYLKRDPHAMSVEVIEVEGEPGDVPLITVAGGRQPWGYRNGHGTTLAEALEDVMKQDAADAPPAAPDGARAVK